MGISLKHISSGKMAKIRFIAQFILDLRIILYTLLRNKKFLSKLTCITFWTRGRRNYKFSLFDIMQYL